MTLLLSIATTVWFLKNFTLWSYDYDTFQPKIGQCAHEWIILEKEQNDHSYSFWSMPI